MTAALQVGSLFTGYGGLDTAVRQVLGGELAWVSDNHPSAVKLLDHRHPGVPNLGDITAIDWASVLPVDVLAAGFPCQDISNAGQRAGIEGKRSGLWSHVADAVRVLRPRLVVLENVSALLVRGLDRVAADLAEVGYDLRWTCLRAADVGAPHRRERWFGLAVPAGHTALLGWDAAPAPDRGGERPRSAGGPGVAAADPDGERQQQREGDQPDLAGRAGDGGPLDWGVYGPAVHRWESALGRSAPTPTVPGRSGQRVLSAVFVEWLMGLPAGHVTGVPDLSRNDQLRLLGNGVVPQQGAAALRFLLAAHLAEVAA
jgi:DNA (cytosine-5)-methyltransferase 1